jgi:hypothetical protein
MAVDSLSKTIYRNLFTEDQWLMIYMMIENAYDDDYWSHLDADQIRMKIRLLCGFM